MNSNMKSFVSSPLDSARFKQIIARVMIGLVFILVGIYLSRPLFDPDFYWHLKTGEWIWQNKSLPHEDLFGVPPLPPPSPRTEFIFTSYWLIQLVMYGLYSLSGMSGIIMFRWMILGICLVISRYWTNLRDTNVVAVLAIGIVLLLEYYFIERPQFISFVCFGALLVILFRFFEEERRRPLWHTMVPLSFIMIVWANMHGGFLIGQAILLFCVMVEGTKFFHSSLYPLPPGKYRLLLISSLTALAASFINPNPLNLIRYLPIIFDSSYYVNANNIEEMSLLEYYRLNNDFTVLIYMATMVLTIVALFRSRQRKNMTWVGILVGTAYMGSQHMRLMPFFLMAAMIFMAKYFETESTAIKSRLLLFLMLVVTTVTCVKDELSRVYEVTRSGWVPFYRFPVRSADFITRNKISGNIYTTMHWGGYLIWRGGSVNKVFYDGRTLSVQRAWEYDNSRKVVMNQRSYWQGLFKMYDIRIAVVPIYEDDGQPNLLTQSISADNEWTMVFYAEDEAVFVRN